MSDLERISFLSKLIQQEAQDEYEICQDPETGKVLLELVAHATELDYHLRNLETKHADAI